MTSRRPASTRSTRAASLALVVVVGLTACSAADPTPTPGPTPGSPTPQPTAAPTATPVATAEPTPRFANEPDAELAALIPTAVGGATIVVAPFDEFALTPGDVGIAFGEVGDRFASLVLAYVEQPRTSLYAMRVDGAPVTTDDLEPHLATAGRYVGIAGLHRDPWTRDVVGGHSVWTRPEDNATALGTHIYTWSSGEFVFLLIGVDDVLNRAIVSELPGEAAPSPTPIPSGPPASGEATPSPSG